MSCYYGSSLRSKRFQSSYCAKVRAFPPPPPSPSFIFFFRSCPSFLDEPRKETLATQATMVATFLDHNSGEKDGDDNENGKKAIGLYQKNNNFAHASHFFCIFLSHHCKSAR